MKALRSYNTESITRFHQRKVHNTEIVETPQGDPPGPPVPENDPPDLPESDLDIPDDPILDFVNSQCHNSEDLDQALQAYQAYQVPSPQDSTMTPERSINHHFTYHIAQASQAKHGSLVDRGANGGLAGSDVRILSRSSRKCTVTGIDSHELQGLDVVQCAALVQTNHGIVNLITNEYACYGKGHTIHSSGQIEWFKTLLMIGLSTLVENRGSAPLMAMLCHYLVAVDSCISLSLVNPLIKIWRGTQLYTLQEPMNGILLSWTCRILGLTALNSLLQCVKYSVWEVCSVN